MDDIVASAQVVLEGVDKVSPAATSSTAALRKLASAGEDVQRKLIDAAQKHQETLKVLNQIYAQNEQAAQEAGTATVQAHNAVTQAVQAQTQAAKNVPPVLNAAQTAANQLQKQLRDAFSVVGIEEFIRKSYMAFTSQEEEMRRVQLAAGGTAEEIKQLHKELQDLASTTGQTTEALAKGFRDFQAGSGLSGGELKAAFRGVVEAADLAGIHVVEMSRIATTAMAQLHISTLEMPQLMGALGKAFAGMGSEAVHILPNVINMMQQLNIQGRGALEGTVATIAALGKAIGDTGQAAQGYAAILDLIRRPGTTLGNRLSDKAQAAFEGGLNDVDLFVAAMDKVEEVRKRHEGDFRGTQMDLELLFDGNQAAIQMSTNYMKMNEQERKKLLEGMRKQYAAATEIEKAHAEFIRESIEGTRKLVGEWNNLQNATGGFLDSIGATGALQGMVDDIKHLRELLEWLDNWFKEHKTGGGVGTVVDKALQNMPLIGAPYQLYRQLHKSGPDAPPHMAAGGVVTEPTLAMIGEAGPEAVVPVGGMAGADGGTQAERDAAEMWGRLHGLAGSRYKHVSLTGQLTQEELDKLLQAGMAGGGGPGGGGGGGGGDRGWGPGSGRGPGAPGGPSDGKPAEAAPLPTESAAGIPGLPGSPSGPALTPEQRKAAASGQQASTTGKDLAGGFSPAARKAVEALAAKYGVSPQAIAAVASIESDFNPNARLGSYNGLFQMSRVDGWRPGMTDVEQVQLYGQYLEKYHFFDKVKNAGIDITKESPAKQAALLQGYQFASSTTDWMRDLNKPSTRTKQSGKVGDKSVNEMTRRFERMLGGSQAGAGTPAAQIAQLGPMAQIAGAPGGPSGPELTHEQRIALGTGGSSEAGGGGGGGGQEDYSRVEEAQSKATRSQAVDPRLKNALQYAAEKAGVKVRVTSGGQEATGRHRVGSHRHDHGRAADLDIVDPETGKKLAHNDPRRLTF